MIICNIREVLKDIFCADPLLGDNLCQLRAMYLAKFYRDIQSKSTEEGLVELTEKEATFLEDSLLLSHYHAVIEPSGLSIPQRLALPQIIKRTYHPDEPSIFFENSSQLDRYVVKKRKEIAAECIAFAAQFQAPSTDFPDYTSPDKPLLYVTSTKQKIPILPCYISTHMMLRFLMETGCLLLIDMRRMERIDGEEKVIHMGCLGYRYQLGRFVPVFLTDSHLTEPAVTIAMVSYLQSRESYGVEKLFSERDRNSFMTQFQHELDISAVILMAAAAHRQVPESLLQGKNKDDFSKALMPFKPQDDETCVALSEPIDLSVCTEQQFSRLYHLSARYALQGEDYKQPVVGIKHIYLGHYQKLLDAHQPFYAARPEMTFFGKPSINEEMFSSEEKSTCIT